MSQTFFIITKITKIKRGRILLLNRTIRLEDGRATISDDRVMVPAKDWECHARELHDERALTLHALAFEEPTDDEPPNVTYDKPAPITKAPKDGTLILVKTKPGWGQPYDVVYWDEISGWTTASGNFGESGRGIEGWWHLPEDLKVE
jgi:hypothetical protein